jgi:adenine deaminase
VAYASAGLADDHECVDYAEALTRLNLGMAVLIREGSTERNLELILKGIVADGFQNSPHLMFCTDDKHPDEILEEGHIDYMVNHAIEMGVPAVTAVQMATLNAAKHFRLEHLVGSLTPGRWADVILAENLEVIVPGDIFVRGNHVAREGKLIVSPPESEYPEWICQTVEVRRGKQADDFKLPAEDEEVEVWVIDLYPDQIINNKIQTRLRVVDGAVQPDPSQDILKLAVVERHGKNGNIGITFVHGFGLNKGALASSVAHDHHNIIVAGTNDVDMAACVKVIEEMQGGLALASGGEVLGSLPLPIGGLMSAEPVEQVIENLENINNRYRELGGTLPAPFMTISFIGLPTVPELGLTDKGLVDVLEYKLISPFPD